MQEGKNLSLERVLQLLNGFGFSKEEAEVYIYVAKTGAQKSKDIAKGLMISPDQLYSILETLQSKGAIISSSSRSRLFSALSFNELIKRHIDGSVFTAIAIRKNKKELIDSWTEITKEK
jgi:sugar-specific transcriptional regulator TrmB